MVRRHIKSKQSNADICFVALRKIKYQVQKSPEHHLLFAVLELALKDYISKSISISDRSSALAYLKGPMPHMQLIDIDPKWVRLVIRSAGIYLND